MSSAAERRGLSCGSYEELSGESYTSEPLKSQDMKFGRNKTFKNVLLLLLGWRPSFLGWRQLEAIVIRCY